jgi:16S rRNA processing protein RimM
MSTDILIAKIRRPHGVRGEVIADSYTFDDTRFSKLKTVTLKSRASKEYQIEKVRSSANGIILKFAEVNDRDAAEALKGYEVYIPESDRLPLPDNEAYVDELVGMSVIDHRTGNSIGEVGGVIELSTGNVIELALTNGTERLVHRNSPEFVRIERSAKKVFVDLLEEYSAPKEA